MIGLLQQFYPQVSHDYTYELNKDFNFSAAHFIPSDKAGKCKNIHGHTYFVNVTVVGDELDDIGFLVDFKKLKELVHDKFDHTIINDSAEFTDANFPTTEVVAKTISNLVNDYLEKTENKPVCLQVLVRETPTSYAVYRVKNK